MNIRAYFWLHLLLTILWLAPGQGLAETSYNSARRELLIPCLTTGSSEQPNYFGALLINLNSGLYLFGLEAVEAQADCSGHFNTATGIYTDIIRSGDNLYDLQLSTSNRAQFRLDKVNYHSRGPSSVWKVSKGQNQLYIGGSIHVLLDTDYPLHPAYYEAYEQADLLVTEVEIAQLQTISSEDLELLLLPDGQSLEDILSADAYRILGNYMTQLGLNLQNYARRRPVWIEAALNTAKLRTLGYLAVEGADHYFANLAVADGKINTGLETIADQYRAINATKQDINAESLIMDSIYRLIFDLAFTGIDQNVDAWRRGDSRYYENAVIGPYKTGSPEDYHTIVTQRNLNWLPQLTEMLETPEREFVLVGATHLYGDESLINLLQAQGYQVERL